MYEWLLITQCGHEVIAAKVIRVIKVNGVIIIVISTISSIREWKHMCTSMNVCPIIQPAPIGIAGDVKHNGC